MSSIKIRIDDCELQARPDQTIMEAADEAGITIPRLCTHPALKPGGSCRLCAVEIEGYRGLPAACTTPVENDMRVRTTSSKVLDFRRETLRLILQDHPRECLGCQRNGTCELQQLVTAVGIDFPYAPPSGQRRPPNSEGAYFNRDYSLCVRCGRCVRVCHEVRGAKAIVFREGEGKQEVGTPFGRSLAEAGCAFCGACVDVCPVGALRETPDVCPGEDGGRMPRVCEGLADIVATLYRTGMELSSKTSVCPVCTAGCGMDFDTAGERGIVRVRPSLDLTGARGQACVQGRFLLKNHLQRDNRILKPLVRKGPDFQEESWANSLEQIAQKLTGYKQDEIAVLTNARLGSEALYLVRKFAAEMLNTKFAGCLAPDGYSLPEEVLREYPVSTNGGGGLPLPGDTDCVLAFGVNPPASQPIAGVYLRKAVMNGARLISAGPLETAPARYADIHLRHYPGTEVFVIAGIIRLLLDGDRAAREIAENSGPELKSLLEGISDFSPESVSKITGVPESDLVEAACLIGKAEKLSIFYGTGLSSSLKYGQALTALRALMQIRGSGPEKGGVILPAFGSGNAIGELAISTAFSCVPREEVLEALSSGKIKAVYLAAESMDEDELGGLSPWLEKLDFAVIQDVVMPGEKTVKTLPPECVFLPMASVLESGGTFTCGGQKARWIEPVLPAPEEAKPVEWVIAALSRVLGSQGFEYETAEAVREEMRRKIPFYAGGPSEGHGQPRPRTGWAPMSTGAAPDLPDKDFPFALVLKEQLEPYFLGPLLAEETRVLFQSPAEVEMNPADAFSMGFAPEDTVRVVMREGECLGRLGMNRFLPPSMVAVRASSLGEVPTGRDGECTVFAARVEKR